MKISLFQPIPMLFVLIVASHLLSPITQLNAQTDSPTAARELRRSPVVQVFEQARDAVVNISATSIIEVRSPFDDLFQFFDRGQQAPTRRYRTNSVGSGFVLHPAGYIVTNAHVVARTAERQVIFDDRREYPAQVIAIDHERDLAILKIDSPTPLKALSLGRSHDLMVGETVIAIGNPLGYQHTCTTGIVSATDREIRVNQNVAFTGLIQTDASINPGNSGGPLLNVLGQLIGINTAIRGDAQNIGFAIPVDQLRSLLPEMLDVERRYGIVTGIELDEVTLNDQIRCRIKNITPESPAASAGLNRAPLLLETVNGKPINNAFDFGIELIGKKPGDSITLTARKPDNGLVTVSITLAQRPKPDGGAILAARFGLNVEELTERMARALNISGLQALLVNNVERNSPAAGVGLRRGDVILQFGRHPARSLDDIGNLLEKIQPGQAVSVTVLRVQGPMLIRSAITLRAR